MVIYVSTITDVQVAPRPVEKGGGPVVWPPLFTAALGWLTRIALERTLGRTVASRDVPAER